MAEDVTYTQTDYENSPSTNTPINAANLNATIQGVRDCAARANDSIPFDNILSFEELMAVTEEYTYVVDGTAVKAFYNEFKAHDYTEITGALAIGETSVTLTDIAITTDSIIDVYTDVFGVNPTAITVETGSLTLTFDAQTSAIGVKVRVS